MDNMGDLDDILSGDPAFYDSSDVDFDDDWDDLGDLDDYDSSRHDDQMDHNEYVDPDTFYMTKGATAFIYINGEIYYGDRKAMHWEMIEDIDSLDRLYRSAVKMYGLTSNNAHPRDVIMMIGGLLGRVGYGRSGTPHEETKFCSFWNTDGRQYDGNLKPCLERLLGDEIIDSSTIVSIPNLGSVPLSEALNLGGVRDLSDEEMEKMELYKRLHLMRGEEKQAAMRKLGLGGKQKQHPMQQALQSQKLASPGQRWWAMSSEDVVLNVSELITEDPDYFIS